MFVPFGTTAPPLAWVPLAPIPKLGSGRSIINNEREHVAEVTGDFPLCPFALKRKPNPNSNISLTAAQFYT